MAEEQRVNKESKSESRIMYASYKRARSARCLVNVTGPNSPLLRASMPAESQSRDS